MVKKNLNGTYLEYDDTKYSIERFKDYNDLEKADVFILRELQYNKIIKVLNCYSTYFIIQLNLKDGSNFLIGRSVTAPNSIKHINKIEHYYAYDEGSQKCSLQLISQIDGATFSDIDRLRITNNTYMVDIEQICGWYGGRIYNLDTCNLSKKYSRIYNDSKISECFSNINTLLVEEERHACGFLEIKDTLRYGIDSETFKINTRIWSELQQRYFDVYSQDEVKEFKSKMKQRGRMITSDDPEEITLNWEVELYLELLRLHLVAKPQRIYTDCLEKEINKELVKKLIKNN